MGGKWARPPRRHHMVFGLQTQPKSWLTGYTFWVNHYLEIVFSKISVVNPPLGCALFYKPIWQLTVNERGHYADSEDTFLFKIEDSPDTRLGA